MNNLIEEKTPINMEFLLDIAKFENGDYLAVYYYVMDEEFKTKRKIKKKAAA